MGKKKTAAKTADLPAPVVQQPMIASNTLPLGFKPVAAPPTEPSEAAIDLGDEHLHVARAEILNGHATPVYAVPQPVLVQPGGTLKSTAGSEHILARSSVPFQQPPQAHSVAGAPTAMQIRKHTPLAKCRVLYLGSTVPLETINGLEAVQQPLRERYPLDEGEMKGIDTWLTVFSSGILMQFVEDKSNITWFPIPTLHVCAAVKAVVVVNGSTGEKQAKFVSLDSQGVGSDHPPIFASIMRRMKGIKVLECHGFIAKSNQAAMSLVQACTHAYNYKEGWTTELPPIELMARLDNNAPITPRLNTTRLIKAEEVDNRKLNPEFYEQPPEHGYFYANGDKHIRNFNIYSGGTGRPEYDDNENSRRRQRSASPAKQRHHNYDPRFQSPPPRYTSKPREEYREEKRKHHRDGGRRDKDHRRKRDKSRDELEHRRNHSKSGHYRDNRDEHDRMENRRRRNHSRDRLDDVSPDRQRENRRQRHPDESRDRRHRDYSREPDDTRFPEEGRDRRHRDYSREPEDTRFPEEGRDRRQRDQSREYGNTRYPEESRDRGQRDHSRDPLDDRREGNHRQHGNNRSEPREQRHRSRDRLEDDRKGFENMAIDDIRREDPYQSRERSRNVPSNIPQDPVEVEDYLKEDLIINNRRTRDEDYYNTENQKRHEDEDYFQPPKRQQEPTFDPPRPPTPPNNDLLDTPREDYDDVEQPVAPPRSKIVEPGKPYEDLETSLGYLP